MAPELLKKNPVSSAHVSVKPQKTCAVRDPPLTPVKCTTSSHSLLDTAANITIRCTTKTPSPPHIVSRALNIKIDKRISAKAVKPSRSDVKKNKIKRKLNTDATHTDTKKQCHSNSMESKYDKKDPMRSPVISDKTSALRYLRKSLQLRYFVKRIAIIGTRIVNKVVFYELDVFNGKARWLVSKRYDEFSVLHAHFVHYFVRVLNPLSSKFLPPFPTKKYKLLTNHMNPRFIATRRVLLNNYLQTVITIPELARSPMFMDFVLPDEDDIFEQDSVSFKTHDKAASDYKHNNVDNLSDSDSEEEVTSVSIPKAQIVRNHYVVYRINVTNVRKRKSFSQWTVLKRFTDFYRFDWQFRQAINEKYLGKLHDLYKSLPTFPPKRNKLFVDHLDRNFIEYRRLLLEQYLKAMLCVPELSNHRYLREFLDV